MVTLGNLNGLWELDRPAGSVGCTPWNIDASLMGYLPDVVNNLASVSMRAKQANDSTRYPQWYNDYLSNDRNQS